MKTAAAAKVSSDSKTSKLKREKKMNGKRKKGVLKKKKKDSTITTTTCPPTTTNGTAKTKNTTTTKTSNNNVAEKTKKGTIPTPSLTHHKHISLPSDNLNYSTNWKQLLNGLPNKSSGSSKKVLTTCNPSNSFIPKKEEPHLYKNKFQNEKKPNPIWFDGIDKTLIEMETNPKSLTQNSDLKAKPSIISFLAKDRTTVVNSVSEYIALDCEMVGTGDDGKDNMLARVSLVNQYNTCVYDKFVEAREPITDYRTAVSGITPEKLKYGSEFQIVQKEVSDLINGKILVGHAVSNDLKVLFLDHPRKKIRDTSRYKPFRKIFEGRTPSLKNLTRKFLGIEIQDGSHNSIIDAQATMKIFLLHKREWEGQGSKTKNKTWNKKKD